MSTTTQSRPRAETEESSPQDSPRTPNTTPAADLDREVRLADINLRIADLRATADFNISAAGRMHREFEAVQRVARGWAESTLVPALYRGNISNCIIALDMAYRMSLPPMTVMRNLYIVNGNPGWSSQFLIATINTSRRFSTLRYRKRPLGKIGRITLTSARWEKQPDGSKVKNYTTIPFDGTNVENWECVAYATDLSTGERLESDPVTIEMAVREGWYTKDGSKWPTMPLLMLSYRAAAFWVRLYAPEISMGFQTAEELTDLPDETPYTDLSVDDTDTTSVAQAKERLRAAHTSRTTPQTPMP